MTPNTPPEAPPVADPGGVVDADLGLGGRVAQQARVRFLNRDGSFNVERKGLPFLQSLNLYHAALTISWRTFVLFFAAIYFALNLLFALAFVACGPGALAGMHGQTYGSRFEEAFFFSVHTLATIGYGNITPASFAANVLVTFEALVGLTLVAIATGIVFARFSRPEARVLFSERAVIAPFRGATAFMFRIANERQNEMLEVKATVSLARMEQVGGKQVRRFYELELERRKIVFFPLTWTLVHPIDDASPLHGVTEEDLDASQAEFVVFLTAIDETFSQSVYARSSYRFDEVSWGAKFSDVYLEPGSDGRLRVDLRKLSAIEAAG